MTRETKRPSGAARDGVFRGVMLLMVGVCGVLWLWGGQEPMQATAVPTLPTPWGDGPVRCPADGHEDARVRTLAGEAETMWERVFFDWAEGPRAIARLSQAAACARAGGDLGALDRYTARIEGWKRHVQRLQDREALRLELAERQGDAEAMQRHAQRLRALLSDGDPQRVGDASRWLSRMQRRARALHAGIQAGEDDDDE